MANPSITRVLLNAAKVLIGSKLVSLRGAADDFFTLGKSGDVGGGIKGVQGDVALFDSENNLWIQTFTLIQSSAAIGTILRVKATERTFPIAVEYNDFTFNGFGVVQNEGEVAASLGTMTRTIVLALAYQSGNVTTGIGETLA